MSKLNFKDLKDNLYNKLNDDKIKINWNKNPIRMDLFISFLNIELIRSNDHLGSNNGWTELNNEALKLSIKGGIVDGVEYLDNIKFGVKLSNPYNNFVNPFYLFEIMKSEGKRFFIDYYKDEINKIVWSHEQTVIQNQISLKKAKENLVILKEEIKFLQTI